MTTTLTQSLVDAGSEQRYIALARLSNGLNGCSDWVHLAAATAGALEALGTSPAVRLWGVTPDGWIELGRHPSDHELEPLSPVELSSCLEHAGGIVSLGPDRILAGLELDGSRLGALEIAGAVEDTELISRIAPFVAQRMSNLAVQDSGGLNLTPRSLEGALSTSRVIHEFAQDAKRALAHDRLSLYLLVAGGYAFARFSSAGSAANPPEEGTTIQVGDVGLRHVILTNEPLISPDLSTDPRLMGRQTRIVARAGFKGLLSVPVRRNNRPFGILSFTSLTPNFYSEGDIPIAMQIADQISAFVENLRVQQRAWATLRNEAHEEERSRLARDIYQAAAQITPRILASAQGMEKDLAEREPAAAAQAARIRSLADKILVDMRRTIANVAPPALPGSDLKRSMEERLEELRTATGMKTRLRVEGRPDSVPAIAQHAMLKTLDEALLNARLHSGAETIAVSLRVGEDLILKVSDDGRGFDPGSVEEDSLGVRHLRELARSLGGFLTVASEQGKGTILSLMLPVSAPQGRPRSVDGASVEATNTLRVVVAARSTLTLGGICRLLEQDGTIRVVGEAKTETELRVRARQLRPDVIVLTSRFGERDVAELVASLGDESAGAAILLVRCGVIPPTANAIASGIKGMIDERRVEEELAQATRAVSEGITVVGTGCDLEETDVVDSLDQRERQILSMIAAGETNAAIGRELFLATKTVERYVSTIVHKIGARNRSHAAALAVSHGMATPVSAAA